MFKKPPVRHILVLVDSTETSARAVDLAAALARALHARLTGIAIIETETLHQLLSAKVLTDAEMGDFEAGLRESAARQLDDRRVVVDQVGGCVRMPFGKQRPQLGDGLLATCYRHDAPPSAGLLRH